MEEEREQCPMCGWSIRVVHGRLIQHLRPPTTSLSKRMPCTGSHLEVR